MVYDGDCGFCTLWIRRWQSATLGAVDYLPSQDPSIKTQYPEIPPGQFQSAVQLIGTDGAVWGGAEAVFRALEQTRSGRWLLTLYRRSTAFARSTERAYEFVAAHRTGFSRLTRWLWGRHVEPPSLRLMRQVFLRLLGVVYLIAFVSLWVQITGLIGHDGIMPAGATLQRAREQLDALNIGIDRYRLFPTLCWFDSSDAFLKVQCGAGVMLSLLLVFGLTPVPCLICLWALYLSLTSIGGVFLEFQWDTLLLETGFLAIFFAPWQWRFRTPACDHPPSRLVMWLLRWLLFRVMFESGCVKLLSGDPSWRNLTALQYHFETQPLPTWIGWWAHQLPAAATKTMTLVMFGVELLVPFLFFVPRRPRIAAALLTAGLQVAIFLTGNYGFFNILTLALCVTLCDDAALAWLSRLWPWRPTRARVASVTPGAGGSKKYRWPALVTWPLAAFILMASLVQFTGMFLGTWPGPQPVLELVGWLQPFRSLNNYGLFAVMTTRRPEIVIEGSDDGVNWLPYRFKYKPGDVKRWPAFVEPHQPRLDWQMWFAALGDYRRNLWLVNVCARLLQGSPPVLGLLAANPFPGAPPRFVRAEVYDYRFTDMNTRRKTGDWWVRMDRGPYLPAVSLRGDRLEIQTNP